MSTYRSHRLNFYEYARSTEVKRHPPHPRLPHLMLPRAFIVLHRAPSCSLVLSSSPLSRTTAWAPPRCSRSGASPSPCRWYAVCVCACDRARRFASRAEQFHLCQAFMSLGYVRAPSAIPPDFRHPSVGIFFIPHPPPQYFRERSVNGAGVQGVGRDFERKRRGRKHRHRPISGRKCLAQGLASA